MTALTEDEAKTKWCPFVRLSEMGGTFNRISPAANLKCIASACMAWRWQSSASMDNPSGVPGAGTQEIKCERGFCGLASKP